MTQMQEQAIARLREQQARAKEYSAPWTVAAHLMDICRGEPESAELICQDLDNPAQSVAEAEKRIKAWADKRNTRSAGSVCVPFEVADGILREFYGLGQRGGRSDGQDGAPTDGAVSLSLADFLG